jgi:hypothetical protein
MSLIIVFKSLNGGVERSPRNAGSDPKGRVGVKWTSARPDLLAPCVSAHGAVSHLFHFAKNKSGEQTRRTAQLCRPLVRISYSSASTSTKAKPTYMAPSRGNPWTTARRPLPFLCRQKSCPRSFGAALAHRHLPFRSGVLRPSDFGRQIDHSRPDLGLKH